MPATRLLAAHVLAGLVLLMPVSALAQQGSGARVAPDRPEAGRPAAPMAEGIEDPATLLRMAESILARGRLREATDLLERAEARLLTRAELASEADRPAVGGTIGELAAARDALARGDAAGASGLIASALRRLEGGEAPSIVALPAPPPTTGAAVAPAPAMGGGLPVPTGPEMEARKPEALPGMIAPPSTKAPPG